MVKSQNFWLWLAFAVSAIYLGAYLIFFVLDSFDHGISVNTYAADGTFQLYNPLRRLQQGQIPGVDFPFFHGIAVPLLHYPVFALFGGNLFAAEVAKYLVSPMMFFISTPLLFFAIFRDIRKTTVASAVAILFCTNLINVLSPGNSLLGLRSTLPIVVAAALLWESRTFSIRDKIHISVNQVVAIVLLALSFVCGVEQGIAAILAYTAMMSIRIVLRYGASLKSLFLGSALVVSLPLVTLGVVAIITLGHPWEALKYALVDIPKDQGWYFGAPPNSFIGIDSYLGNLFTPRLVITYLVILAAVIFVGVAIAFKIITRRQTLVFGFMLLTGTIAFGGTILGYFSPGSQIIPLMRVSSLILAFALVWVLFNENKNKSHIKLKSVHMTLLPLISGLFVAILICQMYFPLYRLSGLSHQNIIMRAREARHRDDYFASSNAWKKRIDAFRPYLNKKTSLWSVYTSTYDSYLTHSLNPSSQGEDYIIHALGDERRRAYTNDFIKAKPDFVITLRPSYFIYEEWLWGPHADFYRALLSHYKIVSTNDSHILWKRSGNSSLSEPKPVFTALGMEEGKWRMPSGTDKEIRAYLISIEYEAAAPFGISQLGRVSRYLVDVKNSGVMTCPISLPPTKRTWSFMIAIKPNESNVYLQSKVNSVLPATLHVKSISYSRINMDTANQFMFDDNKDLPTSPMERSKACVN